MQLRFGSVPQHKETIHVHLKRPLEGWIKRNNDGACKGNNESSGCGGVFHNSDGC
ncbi:hypothetical protein MTR_4g115950 [Medicago truncatula]|uniref:Uncharacterized protein n=1 Tax=Medicago truncatula TaxID=3880 RepID=G7JGJ9_MEDTR|nr:hypothetical protein MTR_4g115950 [Medicago truncatula]